MKYVCLVFYEEKKWDAMSESEQKAFIEECSTYDDVLRKGGHLVGGVGLQSPRNAATLRFQSGQVMITDGPYAETKEQLGGLLLLEAKDLNHAIQLMSNHPGVRLRPFEIRAVDEEMNGLTAAGRKETMETKPTHEQAQLHLQVYDLRREARLRQARDWFFKNYLVDTLDNAMRIAAPGTEAGAFAGMVISYWEQACALLNYGLLHEDLFFETSGEFFGVWELLKPIVPEARERFANKQFLAHLETAAQRYESWAERRTPGHVAAMRQFMQQMRAQSAGTEAHK